MKTVSVHFYVQRNSSFGSAGTIPFRVEQLNVGEAMNLLTGIFNAPVDGIYHFEFSGNKDTSASGLTINLQLNGDNVGEAYAGSLENFLTLSSSSSLHLKAGDRVSLYKFGIGAL